MSQDYAHQSGILLRVVLFVLKSFEKLEILKMFWQLLDFFEF